MARLVQSCQRHPRLIALIWVVALTAALLCTSVARGNSPSKMGTAPDRFDWSAILGGLDAARGQALIESRFGVAPVSTRVLCARLVPFEARFPSIRIDSTLDPAVSSGSEGLLRDAARCREPLLRNLNPFSGAASGASALAAPLPVSVTDLDLAGTPREALVQALRKTQASYPSWSVEVPDPQTGAASTSNHREASADLRRAERLGLIAALIVLAIVLRSALAPLAPIILGVVSVGVALGIAAVLREFAAPPFYVDETISMIGLAVSIDYALFVLHRWYEERSRGGSTADSMRATAIAIRTVLASGAVMIAAMAGMLLVPVAIFRNLALGAITVVALGVAATATLMPPILRLLGDRLDWPRRRGVAPNVGGKPGVWSAIGGWTTRHPLIAVALVALVLVPLNLEARDLRRDLAAYSRTSDVSTLEPADPVTVESAISSAVWSVVEITVDGERTDSVQAGIDRLVASLGEDDRFVPLVTVQWNAAGDLAVISAALADPGGDTSAVGAIDRLRETTVGEAFQGVPASVSVTGPVAARAEILETLRRWESRVRLLVLIASFLTLLTIFRSVIVPLKAIAINLVTVGAVHGLLVVVFQRGIGASWFGFQQGQAVEAWVPLFLFCILFGLSMDYHIFLLSRIREHFRGTGDHEAALVAGLRTTGGVVTGAAAIMAVVFGTFAAGGVPALQQIGFGLAAAVILDATIVRCVLIPALMELLGDANWYLPRWLRWLPDPRLAGGEPVVAPGAVGGD